MVGTRRFDGAELSSLAVPAAEIEAAWSSISADVRAALRGPLEFAAKDDFKNLPRIRDLGRTLAGIAAGDAALATFAELARELDSLADADKKRCVRALIEALDTAGTSGRAIAPVSAAEKESRASTRLLPQRKVSTGDPRTTPLTALKGVGDKVAESFALRSVHTVRDALYFLPRHYEDRRRRVTVREAMAGERISLVGTIKALGPVPVRGGRKLFEMAVADETGLLRLKWFRFQPHYFQGRFVAGMRVVVSGVIDDYRGQKQIVHPDVQPAPEDDDAGETRAPIVPLYAEVAGVHGKKVQAIEAQAIAYASALPDPLQGVPVGEPLLSLADALAFVHAPPASADVTLLETGRSPAHERLIFEELLVLQLGLVGRRVQAQREAAVRIAGDSRAIAATLFPFALTSAQQRVLAEIFADLASGAPLHRLVQGDVGAGKTAVAFVAMHAAAKAGVQSALMAPTELLAEQHFKNAVKFLHPHGVRVGFLSSSVPAAEATRTLAQVANGALDVMVGTHALIQGRVAFKNLGLAIVDEQHRFGVSQRAELRAKAAIPPHLLVMTATPIPRTLALTLYGDLDVSILDELPPGRTPIKTELVRDKDRASLYAKMKAQLVQGRQAYVVYPLVEESEKMDLKDATQMAAALAVEFPDANVALLHGRMTGEQKEQVMRRFASGEVKLLVSTTVIEVGIDVPNATCMVIEHAERFGLSQLHQLRGRVGRGVYKSFCYLVASGFVNPEAWQRLQILVASGDGFVIAEEDLKIRGPGDFIGTRQAGLPELGVANLVRDQDILARAKKTAEQLLREAPQLEKWPVLQALTRETFARAERLAHAG